MKKITQLEFLKWAVSLPEQATFNYFAPNACALATFLTNVIGQPVSCGGYYWRFSISQDRHYFKGWLVKLSLALTQDVKSISAITKAEILRKFRKVTKRAQRS